MAEMRFRVSVLDLKIQEHKFDLLYMSLETWLKCNKDFITHVDNIKYYRKIRVIYLEPADLLALSEGHRTFFENDGVDAF